MLPTLKTILYLHGFRSSPASFKARVMARHLAQRGVQIVDGAGVCGGGGALAAAAQAQGMGVRFVCPPLPISPAQAMQLLLEQHPLGPGDAVVGSSLGGFYATWLAERSGCRCALLNPAIDPARGLAAHLDVRTYFHSDQPFEFKPHYLDELQAWQVLQPSRPERYFLLAAKGDELIDWRDMVEHYGGAAMHVLEGSDHAISDFENHVAEVADFLLKP